ncbi:MICOS complex subunit MIC13 isoform X3 [Harpia harpyja]|uniref:MICOS complex subunit MIC13 isoform X3 n=1 Tax=Harpia harpyja TaxID=202280 RepID=UPI0022B0F0D0|nr:MICOS complex subunit MIC13 isoform X3 [Harpia harpyja]
MPPKGACLLREHFPIWTYSPLEGRRFVIKGGLAGAAVYVVYDQGLLGSGTQGAEALKKAQAALPPAIQEWTRYIGWELPPTPKFDFSPSDSWNKETLFADKKQYKLGDGKGVSQKARIFSCYPSLLPQEMDSSSEEEEKQRLQHTSQFPAKIQSFQHPVKEPEPYLCHFHGGRKKLPGELSLLLNPLADSTWCQRLHLILEPR